MYTGTLMTETVFYPLFACVALALVLALERPTIQRQLVLLGLCLLAFLTRSQAIVLIPAVATAPLVLAWLDRRRLRLLADFKALYGALFAALVAVLVVQLARGHSPYGVLGSYSVTGHATYRPGQVLKWLLYHVSELDLYLGIAPFAALLLLTFSGRSLDRRLRVFLAAALPLTLWLLSRSARSPPHFRRESRSATSSMSRRSSSSRCSPGSNEGCRDRPARPRSQPSSPRRCRECSPTTG